MNQTTKRNIYYVTARKAFGKVKIGWEVKKEKADRISKICTTKDEAISYATHLAYKTKAIVIVRKINGHLDQKIWFEQVDNQWITHSHKYLSTNKDKNVLSLEEAN